MIRKATSADIPDLLAIENDAFATDRFTERNFRHLLFRANAVTLVEEDESGRARGYSMLLFNRGTSLARLYSMAVASWARRAGAGRRLLEAAEQAAREHGAAFMRLEVRVDNEPARAFYEKSGYHPFAVATRYYEDGVDALRMEKALLPAGGRLAVHIPYYEQTLEFTCGAAALAMAMHALDPSIPLDQKTELRIWREATTIFMLSGHGGCGPYGLALSASRRGFAVEMYVSDTGLLFADSVRSAERRQAMELVQEDFLEELRATPVKMTFGGVRLELLERRLNEGGIPIVLISSYRLDRQKLPHWVVVTGFDERFVYLHDPYVDYERLKTHLDRMQVPILKRDFAAMARYGRTQLKAALIVSRAPLGQARTASGE